jgi:hypothetical protein
MPVVELALTKALDQLALAHTAARISDEDLAVEIAAATAVLEMLRAKTTSNTAQDAAPPSQRGQTGGRRNDS